MRQKDHPRIRGEHASSKEIPCFFLGSSPHSRGTLFLQIRGAVVPGIIPAFAGNTLLQTFLQPLPRDHPRIRGGTPSPSGSVFRSMRIIPAFAGNTCIFTETITGQRDHPRIRGEHRWEFQFHYRISGSSPHPRGTLFDDQTDRVYIGIIPASAGNTPAAASAAVRTEDHPRIRGEH